MPDAGQQSVGELGYVCESQSASSLLRLTTTTCDELRQTTVSGPIGRQEHDGKRIDGGDLRSDEQFQPDFFGRDVCPHDAGQAV